MPLSPEAAALMAEMSGKRVLDVDVLRQGIRQSAEPTDVPVVERVDEFSIEGPPGVPPIPVRAYVPVGAGPSPPLLVFFHGGGWVMCNLETHDPMCRRLANGSGSIVVAIDYRLAPEAQFPAAVEDALAAVTWVQSHAAELGGDPARVGVAGDSAGGNLAAVVAVALRDRGAPQVSLQVLIYPVTDGRLDTASYAEFAEAGGNVTREEMAWFWDLYVGNEDRTHPYASPLMADLSSLPSALVVVAECDPLRDEGTLYARKLRDSGCTVRLIQYDGSFHGFFGFTPMLEVATRANAEVCEWIRQSFEDMEVDAKP